MKTNYVGLLKKLFQRCNIGNTMTCGGLLVGIRIVGNYFGAKAVGEDFSRQETYSTGTDKTNPLLVDVEAYESCMRSTMAGCLSMRE